MANHRCWRMVASDVLYPIGHYLTENHRLFSAHGRKPPSVPGTDALKVMVESAFWASLRAEEERYPKFSIIYARKDECADGLEFQSPRLFLVEALAALAPSLSHRNSRLGVVRLRGASNLFIWGITQEYPIGCLEVRVLGPGRIMIQANGARLGLIDKETAYCLLTRRHWDRKLQGPMPFELAKGLGDAVAGHSGTLRSKVLGTMLLQITEAMHAHRHGGALVVVPGDDSTWETSISLAHKFRRFDGLQTHLERMIHEVDTTGANPVDLENYFLGQYSKMDQRVVRLVATVGALTAVDGATILTDSLDVLGFGAKIQIRPDPGWRKPFVRYVPDSLHENKWDRAKHEREFHALGGTRHQSAAFLVAKHRGLVAIVASQDGGLSIISCEPSLKRVTVTRRVEMLLE
jgi:sensor domain DACNV-containing protein